MTVIVAFAVASLTLKVPALSRNVASGTATVTTAVAVPPVPPSFDVTLPVVFVFRPTVVPVTFTANEHEAPPASVTPERAAAFADRMIVPPPQLPVSPSGVAMSSPLGSVSVTPIPVSVVVLGLVRVKVSVVVCPISSLGTPKLLVIVGGAGESTVTLAVAVAPVPPSIEITFSVMFVLSPGVVPVTFRANVHEPPPSSVAPDRPIAFTSGDKVIVPPPQLPVRLAGAAITRPLGRVSVTSIP